MGGYDITPGMVYLGEELRSVSGSGMEPALIRSQLAVDRLSPNRSGQGIGYWPSYTELSPASRAAYLEWLSAGRAYPEAYIGYVFLFFYGLERRVLVDVVHDPAMRAELPEIRDEVTRLLHLYGSSSSFSGYATSFLRLIAVLDGTSAQQQHPGDHWDARDTELAANLGLDIQLAQLAADRRYLPADLALDWALHSSGTTLRTPARRCSREFSELFRLRYTDRHGDGAAMSPSTARLVLTYHPASASFGGRVALRVPNLPEMRASQAPLAALRELADLCSSELEPYSRWLGRKETGQSAIAGLSLLPRELIERLHESEVGELRRWLDTLLKEATLAEVSAAEIWRRAGSVPPEKPRKNEALALCRLLEKLGVGIEPDVRFGTRQMTRDGIAVLFRLPPNSPGVPSAEYTAAALLLRLGVAVAVADGTSPEEEETLTLQIEVGLQLTEGEKARLKAQLRWLLANPPRLSGLADLIASLSGERRTAIGEFLVAVAGADGHLTQPELAALEKGYAMLGLNRPGFSGGCVT